MFFHPLDQFEILPLFMLQGASPVGITVITNLTVILIMNVYLVRLMFKYIFNKEKNHVIEFFLIQIYNLVKSIIKSNTNLKRYQYFPVLFYLFLFILVANLIGLIPYSFTITSSFVITFFIALMHFIGINIIGLVARR